MKMDAADAKLNKEQSRIDGIKHFGKLSFIHKKKASFADVTKDFNLDSMNKMASLLSKTRPISYSTSIPTPKATPLPTHVVAIQKKFLGGAGERLPEDQSDLAALEGAFSQTYPTPPPAPTPGKVTSVPLDKYLSNP